MKIEKIEELHQTFYLKLLDPSVLVVAVVNKGDPNTNRIEWSAYIGSVSSNYLEKKEYDIIAKNGSKLQREIAEILFSFIPKRNYVWRY